MITLGPFGGLLTAITAHALAATRAQYLRNVRIESGELTTRNGFSNISAAPGSFTACLGLDYIKGYENLTTPKEAFLSIENRSGTVKPYEIHPTTGVRSEIQHSGSPLSLGAGEFKAVSFNGQSLVLKRGAAVYEHNVGDLNHFVNVDRDRPANLLAAPSVVGEITEPIVGTAPLTTISWAALAGVTNATNAVFVAVNGTGFDMNRGPTAPANQQVGSFRVALPASLDASDLKKMEWTFNGVIGPLSGFGLSLVNNLGATFALTCTHTYSYGLQTAEVLSEVPAGADLSAFTNTTHLDFTIPGTKQTALDPNTYADEYTISAMEPFETGASTIPTVSGTAKRLRFGFAPYDDLRDQESLDVTAGAWIKIDDAPTRYFTDGGAFLGNYVEVTAPTVTAPATKMRLYVQFESDSVWRKVATLDAAEKIQIKDNRTTLLAKPERILTELTPIGAPSSIAVFKGFVAYGYEVPSRNVKMSAIGQPWRLSRADDTLADLEAGATLSVADGFDDVPKELVGAGDVLFALGERGVYASYGARPLEMSPFQLVPKSKGILGRAACRFMGDEGMPGCAYVGVDQEVWLIKSAAGTRQDYGFPVEELTFEIRGAIREYLTQTAAPDLSKLGIGVDLLTDSLWVTYGNRAMVYRRTTAIDGRRSWEFYEYAGTGWNKISLDHPFGIRAVRVSGQFDSLERTAAGASVRGLLRDGGVAMPEGYWRSGVISTPRVRVFAGVLRGTEDSSCRLDIDSTEFEGTYTLPAGKNRLRFDMAQKGLEHTVTVLLSEAEGPVSLVELEIHEIGKKRSS
jgi:hypothetical protein